MLRPQEYFGFCCISSLTFAEFCDESEHIVLVEDQLPCTKNGFLRSLVFPSSNNLPDVRYTSLLVRDIYRGIGVGWEIFFQVRTAVVYGVCAREKSVRQFLRPIIRVYAVLDHDMIFVGCDGVPLIFDISCMFSSGQKATPLNQIRTAYRQSALQGSWFRLGYGAAICLEKVH